MQTILVLGATGQQGGAVARRLRGENWPVRGFVRDPRSEKAQALTELGVELAVGNLDDQASLERAMDGVYGVFSVQTYTDGVDIEAQHGKLVADVAQAAGVQHFVYSSVGGAERASGIPHFESKWQVEEHLNTHNLPRTILRPVFFMENFLFAGPAGDPPTLTMALQPDTKLQMIAVEDIATFVALAFANPKHYIGQALELAGDELTLPQIVQTYSRVRGVPVEYRSLPTEIVRAQNLEMGSMFEWFNSAGYAADIAALRKRYPALLTFEAWLRKTEAPTPPLLTA